MKGSAKLLRVWLCCLLREPAHNRPAGSALLDNHTDVVGIPAFLPMDPGSTAGFYFVTAREATQAISNGAQPGSGAGQLRAGSGATSASDAKLGSGSSGSRARRPLPLGTLPFEGLQLGPPLGAHASHCMITSTRYTGKCNMFEQKMARGCSLRPC